MIYVDRFKPGDKVLFHGLKAKVREFPLREEYSLWAVPISIQGSDCITLAHEEVLSFRGEFRVR